MYTCKTILSTILLLTLGWVQGASAARDPIQNTLIEAFPSIVITNGPTYTSSYKFKNNLPYTLVHPLSIQKVALPSNEYTYNDECSGKYLTPGQECLVTIYLKPTSSGIKTNQLIIGFNGQYDNNQVPLPNQASLATGSGSLPSIQGTVTTPLPATANVGTAYPWSFTYTNQGSITATGINLNVTPPGYSTTCTSSLNAGASCTVNGSYTPTNRNPYTVTATLSYAQGTPVTLSTSTNTGGGGVGNLVCTATIPFPAQVVISTSNIPVTFNCLNETSGSITITSVTPTYPLAPGWVYPAITQNCTSGPLLSGAGCNISNTFTAPGSAAANQTFQVDVVFTGGGTSPVTASTSTDVVTSISNTRTFKLINNCNFDVWWSMVGGAIANQGGTCPTTPCPTGSTCNTSAGICYYNNYGPSSGTSYQLLKNNGSGTVTTQIIDPGISTFTGDQILWSGLISASTQCSGSTCGNNACGNQGGASSCAPGVGFDQPATEAEFTLKTTGSNVDSYDISNVNGFSIPISMSTNQTATDYSCGNAGSYTANGHLSACKFNNPSVTLPDGFESVFYWVTNTGGSSCPASCPSGQLCGTYFNASSNSFQQNCGDFLGYWALNQICQTQPNFSYTNASGKQLNCNNTLGSPFPTNTYTLTNLLKCTPPDASLPLFNSCYLSYPPGTPNLNQCCGCTNWTGIAYPSASCPSGQVDPQWITQVLPNIQWMKKFCPTSYSYPYDDKASSFTCTSSSSTEYTITFCPGDPTGGLPSGITDGRG